MTERMPRIRLFNVKFSPNLGDGLLAECLEMAMKECGGDASGTYSVDLSARTRYARGDASRSTVLRVLDGLPSSLRSLATAPPRELLLRRKWRPHYEQHLKGADAVVIGGGNLLTDMDLNFPVKVASALEMAARQGLPSAIYGVGVASHWSAKGTALMQRALERAKPIYVSVRDENSKRNFDSRFAAAAGRLAIVVRDPGLMIGRYLPTDPAGRREGIGLCVTSAVAIRYHSTQVVSDEDLATWYANLCKGLSAEGFKVVAFTNGSPEDEVVLDQIEPVLREAAGSGFERRRPDTPTELASFIASFSGLVAHRMHAIIAGVSLGVPVFALLWDEKLTAFMRSIERADCMAFVQPGNEPEVVSKLVASLDGSAAAAQTALLDETFEAARDLFRVLAR
ncbi:polysaccharide pyruvyl transferase family protein [Antarcticirhabdus aurantiaca]|uniref:Polysaccharide pyruvyl transferase family protein n=1 Tax=Antarcticirhabdus aurantiaca TaxID=2606717 RepID=A0ACD4NR28_9HYPH|nr:polysaccharide pyruvyl transferase family protein [Antarcticirhabdus aurantiaca]WAJ29172.1 polysaccharide pyruvyl transferase family protein [Jeongeuplla avenae]